jgi:hypothetical protein
VTFNVRRSTFGVRLFSVCFGLSRQISLERGHRTEDTEDGRVGKAGCGPRDTNSLMFLFLFLGLPCPPFPPCPPCDVPSPTRLESGGDREKAERRTLSAERLTLY